MDRRHQAAGARASGSYAAAAFRSNSSSLSQPTSRFQLESSKDTLSSTGTIFRHSRRPLRRMRSADAKAQEGCLVVRGKTIDVSGVSSEDLDDVRVGRVESIQMDDFRRMSVQYAHRLEVVVSRDEEQSARSGRFPNLRIGCTSETERPHVRRVGKEIGDRIDDCLREVLVEEESRHRLEARYGGYPPFPLSCERQGCQHILMGQLWKVPQEFGLLAATRQVGQDFANGDARSPDARLAEADLGIDADAVERTHAAEDTRPSALRQGSPNGPRGGAIFGSQLV